MVRKIFTYWFLLLGIAFSFSQQYPVQIIPVVTPPYSVRLVDYATSSDEKVQLQLLMTDLQEPQHEVGIKFWLASGSNTIAQSTEYVVGFQPFTLTPGNQVTLTNVDLRSLFELQNLSGINATQYAQPLPDGVYQFCFQAYDFYTKNALSVKQCATVVLTQYDPPMLNLPSNGEKKQAVTPYGGGNNILFQWMPRQIAPNTRYTFTLKELWDTEQSPISGFLSAPPLWEEETTLTHLNYGLGNTPLIPGKRYAWQVRAQSGNPVWGGNPTEDNGVYKNNGLSEIYYFDYVENCDPPTLLMAKNVGRGRVELSWSIAGEPSDLYQVQYRLKGGTTDWITQESYQPKYIITNLEDLTEYEYRIGNVCGEVSMSSNWQEEEGNAYVFSGIQYFTTDSEDATNEDYQCGVMPSIDIANQNLLQGLLGVNEEFTAGDFPVTVIQATGSNGIYSGEGYIVVPYLLDTKVKVSFSNIKLNTDKQLISGVIETTYDPTEKNVVYVGDILNDLGDIFDEIVKIIDDTIENGGMSPKDFDDLSSNLGVYTEQSGGIVSNLYDQGLVSTELRDKIQAEKDKIDNILKNLNCIKDEKGKGSNEDFKFEDECSKKLRELKQHLQNYENLVNEAKANACIWNIAPNENLKGKTFYFQRNIKDKVAHKLKTGDYPLSFNRKGYVYSFISNGQIYTACTDGNFYKTKGQDCIGTNYIFDNPSSVINVLINETVDDKITINGQEVIAQRDCSLDAKDKGKGLDKDVLFTKTVEGKYKVSISKKNGKFVSKFELTGKRNSKIPDAQKKLIEKEVQNSIDDILKDLKNIDELSKIQTNSSGFYVKQMTGREWLNELSDLGTSVWENASLPKDYWNKDEGNDNSNIKVPPLFAGVSDGVVGEVTAYPQLVKLGYDVATKEEVRSGLWESVKNISVETIKEASVSFYEQKKDNYTSDKPYVVQHTVSKDAVELASLFMGGGLAKGTKGLKNTVENVQEGVEEVGKRIKKEALEKARKAFLKGFDKEFVSKLKKIPGFDKVEKALVESWKKHHGSKFSLQHIYDNNLIDKIDGFELKLNDELGNFTADMKLKATRLNPNGIHIEFKSWKPGSFSFLNGNQYKSQLKAYMKSGDFEQIFDAKKLVKEGIKNPDTFVKQKIVNMIKKNADEFWNDIELKSFFKKQGVSNIEKLDVNSPLMKHFKAK